MSGQPEPTESVSHRTVLPRIPGWPSGLLPWWGAVLVAVTATLVGFAYHAGAGTGELGAVFATFYVLGCLAAVLLVRRSGIFATVIQPPLILFISVPSAYFLMHSGQISGLKDILINCGYPLIERFPLMFFTSVAVLAVGVARWYLDKQSADAAEVAESTDSDAPDLAERVARRLRRAQDPDAEEQPARRSRRPRQTAARAAQEREPRRTRAGQPSRARHNRPPESDIAASAAAADRRERAATRERYGRPRPDEEPRDTPPRRARRTREPSARDPREPRQPRRTPPPSRSRAEDAPDSYERPRRRREYDSPYADYQPGYRPRPEDRYPEYPDYPEPPRRAATEGAHHPVSRVRYRSTDDERRTEHRTRPRATHRRDDWD
ncbi:hypothetical protein MN2019_09835 [Mycolicibacterium neoaurum]|uniref:DUF6542 domain-containing protein n=1 Tax=Mycolicibacterium neoaurum TaxID=1795 RepID=UPI001BCBACC6|nr:DUF6542 domain-containing protein [Mycolicibacterium neoaurum]QVI29560.1 hypothetical protein MN2019_09835 [Mycolicibacterium neoaurum]